MVRVKVLNKFKRWTFKNVISILNYMHAKIWIVFNESE